MGAPSPATPFPSQPEVASTGLFLLPRLACLVGVSSRVGFSRGTQQRHSKRCILTSRVNASIDALNELAGFERAAGAAAPCGQAQRSAQTNLWEDHEAVRPSDEIIISWEAFLKLRGTSNSDYRLPTNLASYRKGALFALSLPSGCKDAADLLSLLPGLDRETLANFERIASRSDSEVQTLGAQLGPIMPYFDPVLRADWRTYAAFLRTLDKAGLIRWSLTYQT